MAIESKFKRVEDPADPRRCQTVVKNGQCPYEACEGSTYCPMHGGTSAVTAQKKIMLKKYQLAQWQARSNHFSEDGGVKSLREEIGILKMTLEQVITQCKSPMDIVLWSGKIGDLVTRIEKVVVSCNRLEASSGMLLDKAAALTLASQMVEIIATHVNDPEAIDQISNDIIQVIVQLNGTEKDT